MDLYGFGRYLRDTRESLNCAIEDAVEQLRIKREILESFESGYFDIPNASDVQIRGFIRNYARFLQIDADRAIEYYEAALVKEQRTARRRENRRQVRQRRQERRSHSTQLDEQEDDAHTVPTIRTTPKVPTVRPPTAPPMAARSRRRPQRIGAGGGMMVMMAGMMVGAAALTGTFFMVLYFLYQLFPVEADDSTRVAAASNNGFDREIALPPTITPTFDAFAVPTERAVPTLAIPVVGVSVTLEVITNSWISVSIDGRAMAARPVSGGEQLEYIANTEIIIESSDIGALGVTYNESQLGIIGDTGKPGSLIFNRDTYVVTDDPPQRLIVSAPPQDAIIAPVVTPPPGLDYVTRFEAPYTVALSAIKENRPLTLFFYDVTNSVMLAGVDIEKQMPVVSAVKGPILIYFLDVVPESIWNVTPVTYWNARNANDVPDEYRDHWEQHRVILRDLYRMIVVSDNPGTGNALAYAYNYNQADGDHPIQAFNNWAMRTVGMSAESGMREWDEGGTANPAWVETRFNGRMTTVYSTPRFYNNMYSALDLARFYQWLYTEADPNVYRVAVEVMSIVEGFPGVLEDTAFRLGGTPVSKDGFVGPGARHNARNERLTADAGLILIGDRAYIIVTMAIEGGDKMADLYNEMRRIIQQDRGMLFWPGGTNFVSWVRSNDGPYAGRNINDEAANFILEYMTDIGQRPSTETNLDPFRPAFEEAARVWFGVFPDGVVPSQRTPEQDRIIAARYGNSGERLYDIALDLGFVGTRWD